MTTTRSPHRKTTQSGATPARTWRQVRSDAVASGLDESGVAMVREQLADQERAHRVAELRKELITQADLARLLGVGQPPDQPNRTRRSPPHQITLKAHVEALGGNLQITAAFNEHLVRIAYCESGLSRSLLPASRPRSSNGPGVQPSQEAVNHHVQRESCS